MRSFRSLFWKLLSYFDYFVMSHLSASSQCWGCEISSPARVVVTVFLSNIKSHWASRHVRKYDCLRFLEILTKYKRQNHKFNCSVIQKVCFRNVGIFVPNRVVASTNTLCLYNSSKFTLEFLPEFPGSLVFLSNLHPHSRNYQLCCWVVLSSRSYFLQIIKFQISSTCLPRLIALKTGEFFLFGEIFSLQGADLHFVRFNSPSGCRLSLARPMTQRIAT